MDLHGKNIAIIATDKFEDAELMRPMEAVINVGGEVTVISDKTGEIIGESGDAVPVDKTVDEAKAEDYDGLLIPGGVKNPDVMRTNETAVGFVRSFFNQHKPVGAICHGLWLLVEADVVKGRTLTSWPSLRTDIENAGGTWVDEEVVTDGNLTTSRKPEDLDAFCVKIAEKFTEGRHARQAAM